MGRDVPHAHAMSAQPSGSAPTMPFMGYPGYPMAYGYPMASQPVAGSATAQQPAPQMMTYQASQYFQAPQYVAPRMEYQTVMESKEITIQVPKVIMEEVEITYQVPAMETKTRTVQRPKTIMEDKGVTVQEPRTVMETRSVQVPLYMNQAMPGATTGSMVAPAPAADGLAYQPTQDDAISA